MSFITSGLRTTRSAYKDFDITYPGMPDDLIKDDVALTIALVADQPDA